LENPVKFDVNKWRTDQMDKIQSQLVEVRRLVVQLEKSEAPRAYVNALRAISDVVLSLYELNWYEA
jgi:hypothetical protein